MKDITEQDLAERIPLAARKNDQDTSRIRVGSVEFGGSGVVVIAGPCAVESESQVVEIARAVRKSGATMLRGGAFKPLTFPYRNAKTFELGVEGLKYLRTAGREAGLPTVSEIMDARMLDIMVEHVDMLQVGSRNMQNFSLLQELSRSGKPVLLKRHFGASLRDWLGAAEYLLNGGNQNVVLCERGITVPHTHHPQSRFVVDVQAVPAVHEYTHLPIIVDPSHSTFRRRYVIPVARAAVAAGADGIIIDVHPRPDEAAVDPLQALDYEAFGALMGQLRGVAVAIGRTLP